MTAIEDMVYNMTRGEVIGALKMAGVQLNWSWSNGGGISDPNRDHRSWCIEFIGNCPNGDTFVSLQVNTQDNTGRYDGKARCRAEANDIARRQILVQLKTNDLSNRG